jgi:hypothetical protein
VAQGDRHQDEPALSRRLASDLRSHTHPVEIDRRVLDRVAARTSVADLTIDGIAEAIADVMKAQRREILDHVNRVLQLVKLSASNRPERTRVDNIHRRLIHVESELRRLCKGSK